MRRLARPRVGGQRRSVRTRSPVRLSAARIGGRRMSTPLPASPWQINDSEFYEMESRQDQLRFLLQYAVLAPSSRNAQPWQFRITPEGIEVLPDLTRRLPVVDPFDREMWLGIGAAIANLRIAA